ncbi:NADH dehydrogenase [ubiquinone] flavoprotein 3, mitochondrial-like isoform X2 [Mercenaria mercenaria]|uniref:NADH dehydrogenase [ubiquinone] flavoprotein 3, mitochondrial-like isoform X2 n=1 Tax=Mercenaria mercenaria TaxID=6596 RepID=UPI001E1D5964|nr:NADH dehydrogenase [ubiquinone] flavoprotein 3, mitochondrial-like isoform X2 [Mercenaria mercenaria]
MSVSRNFNFLRVVANRSARCLFSTESGSSTDTTQDKKVAAAPPPPPPKPATPAPSDNTKYQCKEYYEHTEWSFYDVETAMASKRVGQPSSKTK